MPLPGDEPTVLAVELIENGDQSTALPDYGGSHSAGAHDHQRALQRIGEHYGFETARHGVSRHHHEDIDHGPEMGQGQQLLQSQSRAPIDGYQIDHRREKDDRGGGPPQSQRPVSGSQKVRYCERAVLSRQRYETRGDQKPRGAAACDVDHSPEAPYESHVPTLSSRADERVGAHEGGIERQRDRPSAHPSARHQIIVQLVNVALPQPGVAHQDQQVAADEGELQPMVLDPVHSSPDYARTVVRC